MKLSELVTKESVVENLASRDKEGVIRELVKALKSARKQASLKVEDVVAALMKREKIGSTGMGGGVAVPHAKVAGVPALIGAFGRSVEGVDFSAVDGEKVYLIFLIVAPHEEANAHLVALKRISAAVRSPNMMKFLRAAKSAKDIHDIFRELDEASGS